jgi:hypothetical protein
MNVMKRMVGKATVTGSVAAFFLFLEAATAQAQTLVDPLGGKSFSDVVANVTSFLLTDIAIPLSVIMVLVGAFQFMTSAGDPEKISQARKTILYAAVGLGLALIAKGITSIIQSVIKGS